MMSDERWKSEGTGARGQGAGSGGRERRRWPAWWHPLFSGGRGLRWQFATSNDRAPVSAAVACARHGPARIRPPRLYYAWGMSLFDKNLVFLAVTNYLDDVGRQYRGACGDGGIAELGREEQT